MYQPTTRAHTVTFVEERHEKREQKYVGADVGAVMAREEGRGDGNGSHLSHAARSKTITL